MNILIMTISIIIMAIGIYVADRMEKKVEDNHKKNGGK